MNQMAHILNIDIIENGKGGHDDLLFSIPDLFDNKAFDTYYFGIEIEPANTVDGIKNAVAQLLNYWRDKVVESKTGETIYLPIDFSDQYTGCLRIKKQNKQLTLTYGYSKLQAWAVNPSPLNPGNFYKEINDFQADPNKDLVVDESNFITVLDEQIAKLKK